MNRVKNKVSRIYNYSSNIKFAFLSLSFYADCAARMPCMLRKITRPYAIIPSKNYNFTYAIPFHSNIYQTGIEFENPKKNSIRPGLDFQKTLLVEQSDLDIIINRGTISALTARIRSKLKIEENQIADVMDAEIERYKRCIKSGFVSIYAYSTLQYFHEKLGINSR
ncbi:MAG: hypothetical protein IKN12_01205 [Selenomonadaceae bacterium]|nr:hypothetical protein [Selenomonadaceae bacterium]